MLVVLSSHDLTLDPYAAELASQGFVLNGNELTGPHFWCRLDRLSVSLRGGAGFTTLTFNVEVPDCPRELKILSRGRLTSGLASSERDVAIPTGDPDFDAACMVFCGDRQTALDYLTVERRRLLLFCLLGVPLEIKDGKISGKWTVDTGLEKYLQPLVNLRGLSQPPEVKLPPAGWVRIRKGARAARPLGVWALLMGAALAYFRPTPGVTPLFFSFSWMAGAVVSAVTLVLAILLSKGGALSMARAAILINRLYLLCVWLAFGAYMASVVGAPTAILAAVMTGAIPLLVYGLCDRVAGHAID